MPDERTEGTEWDPWDRSLLSQIRAFEAEQPGAIEPLLGVHLGALEKAQVLLLNAIDLALQQPITGDASAPVFALCHRTVDDLRAVELTLRLGYIYEAASATRDALESSALALLLSKRPTEVDAYFTGTEFSPGMVRKALEDEGLSANLVEMLARGYDILSLLSHPNPEGIALTVDEEDKGGGNILRTFRAGGTREPKRLQMVGNLALSIAATVVLLEVDAIAPHIPAAQRERLYVARKEIWEAAKPALAAAVQAAERRPPPSPGAYVNRAERRQQKREQARRKKR
jgi:hypothetical protein